MTAFASALLDNVTTVVLMTPVVLSISRTLGISPVPYLISIILASNIGGTATLIGDPPNILIGSASGLDFMAFLVNLAPVVLVILAVFVLAVVLLFRGHLQVPDERREAVLEAVHEEMITDRGLLIRTLVILAVVIVGFLVHGILGLEVATIALLGATLLLLVGGLDVNEALRGVEWVDALLLRGPLHPGRGRGADRHRGRHRHGHPGGHGGRPGPTTMALLWFSAGASAIIDNIPYTATAIPIVDQLIAAGLPSDALWWSLALGACLGGNLTIVGASANVVVANLAERAGTPSASASSCATERS